MLEANGIPAVSSTAGAGTFRPEWAREFAAIPEVYVCFDHDEAGRRGAMRVGQLIPHARLVELPEEVGASGDVTDFFVRLRRGREDFLKLLNEAKPALAPTETVSMLCPAKAHSPDSLLSQQVERIKAQAPIERVASQYT